ncbi:uncharacterized protein LOC132293271 isoform X3 [Cornus florida]|uniref:uncharacterized protein LOC132293271 isoform X3 n=1 Tax=Cornus florida TaxID=4283 RepID=UPI0028993884|nr:uncharacterized protein LOC132293271 isoform X3 [Cornus florida]
MLQWMGGSKRKVTTSRKSTQKRQKQYFEQRRRQLRQQQQTNGLESCSDVMNTCSQSQKNNRSLDILSLLNLSTVAEERNSSFHSEMENLDGNGWTVNYHVANCSPPVQRLQADRVTPASTTEFKETRTPLIYQEEVACPKMLHRAGNPDCHNKALNGNVDKLDQRMTARKHQHSILDLLGDDVPCNNSEGENEAHVAFSLEGLGKVESETPVQSPQQPGRIFSYGCSKPLNATRQALPSKNHNSILDDLEVEMDVIMQDIDMPCFRSSLEQPFFSRGITDSFSKSIKKLSNKNKSSQLNGAGCGMNNFFGHEEILYNREDKNDNILNAKSRFLDDDFLDESEYDSSWKNWPHQINGRSLDCLNFGKQEISDCAFDGPYISNIAFDNPYRQKKRVSEEVTCRSNILASRATYSKHQMSENDFDFIIPDGTWYSTVGKNCDGRDVTNKLAWSCLMEDARDNMSMLSEESCSSSAVRGKASENPPSNSMTRQNSIRHGSDLRSPTNKCGEKNTYYKEAYRNNMDSPQQGEDINGPQKFRQISNSSRPAHYSHTNFQKEFGPHDSWLYEEGYNSVDIKSGLSSFCQTSDTKKRASSGCKLSSEDLFGAFPVPELHFNAQSPFGSSKHNISAECSPCGSFFSEKHAFCQPFSPVNSNETPIFSNIGSRLSKPNLSPASNIEGGCQDSFHVSASHTEREFSNIPVQESVRKDWENKSEIQPTECRKFEQQKDICTGSNGLSSENRKQMDDVDFEENSSGCGEATDRTPEMTESIKATCCPVDAEETSSSVKIPDKCEANIDKKINRNVARTSLPCQNGCREIENSGPKGKVDGKGQNNSVDPSYPVMMLESYVLQLLCVQKVLKDASAQDISKKVR